MPSALSTRTYLAAVTALLLVLAAELVLSIRQQSQTIDEAVHLFSGNQYWEHRDFGANPEHPPLVKLIAAAPLRFLDLRQLPVIQGNTKRANGDAGLEFLHRNNVDSQTILFRARIAASLLTLVLAILVALCARDMFGQGPAVFALALLVFEPNILANGALITTDMGATCGIFASVFTFYRYVKQPSAVRLITSGIAVALTLAAKHSALVITGLLVLLALTELLRRDRLETAKRLTTALLGIFTIALVGLWSFYTFRYAARPEGAALSPTLDALAHSLRSGLQSKVILAMAQAHFLPESYLWGLTDVFAADEGRPTFLLGQVYPTGQWFYFPLVFLIKATIPFLALLMAAPLTLKKVKARREFLFLIIPPATFLAISMASGLNIGIRHILPIFPFLIVLAGMTAYTLAQRSRFAMSFIGAAILFHAVSSLHAFPNYFPYSNEIAGGPSHSYRLMTDANVDWSQGLIQTATYLADHHITDCWITNRIDSRFYGIPCKQLPNGLTFRRSPGTPAPPNIQGTILISANEAAGQAWGPGELNPYHQFFDRQPDDIIANSILVFRGTFDVSRASALSHAEMAQQVLTQKKYADALTEAQTAAQTFPGSAEVQAILCQVLKQMNQEKEGQRACDQALSIARSVHPEYQLKRVPALRALVENTNDGGSR